jgi:hypothetical protein
VNIQNEKVGAGEPELYEQQFLKLGFGVFFVTLLSAGLFIWLTLKPFEFLGEDVKLDGQTLANYFSFVFSTTVAFAGAWVAIRIAESAQTAQLHALELQAQANILSDPTTQRSHQVLVACNRLNSAHRLLDSALAQTLATSRSVSAANYEYFISTARQLRAVVNESLLDADLIYCCIASLVDSAATRDKFLGAVNCVMKHLHVWDSAKSSYGTDEYEVNRFNDDTGEFFESFEQIMQQTNQMDDWPKVASLLTKKGV